MQTDKTKESLTEVNKELRAILADRPVTEEELVRVQANETLSLPGSRETLNSVGSSITDLVQFRWPGDYYDTMADKIRALKTSDLDAAAKQVIHPDSIVWVVVGDRAKIESGIRELISARSASSMPMEIPFQAARQPVGEKANLASVVLRNTWLAWSPPTASCNNSFQTLRLSGCWSRNSASTW